MKKLGFFFLLSAALASAGVATFFYVWRQATKLPDWYSDNPAKTRSVAEIQQSRTAIEQRIQAQTQAAIQPSSSRPNLQPSQVVAQQNPQVKPQVAVSSAASQSQASNHSNNVEVQLKAEELNDLIVTNLTEKSPPKALAGFQTKVENNTLKTGAVVDIKELQKSKVGSKEDELLSQLSQNLPSDQQKVYIGIEGQPEVKNGRLQLGENTRVRVGNLSLTLAEIRDRFGISPEQIQEKLNVDLNLRNLNVEDIEFKNGTAVLRGSAKDALRP